MSIQSGEIRQSVIAALEGVDQDLFEMGYKTAKDPDAFVTFGGAIHPAGEWRATSVTVRLHAPLTELLGDRGLLAYEKNYDGDLLAITEPSFVIGSLAAAIETRAKQA